MARVPRRSLIVLMTVACLLAAAGGASAGPIGLLNGASHNSDSARFVEGALAGLGFRLLIAPGDPFGADVDAPPSVLVIRGYDFPEGTADRVKQYVSLGGRVLLLGAVADDICAVLGITQQPVADVDVAKLAAVIPDVAQIPGAPDRVPQRPSLVTRHDATGAASLAAWQTDSGEAPAVPAITAFPVGAALSFEPQPEDELRMAWLLAALIGKLDPGTLQTAAEAAERSFGHVGRLPSWAESQPYLARSVGDNPEASKALDDATSAYGSAVGALQAKDWPRLLASALGAQEALNRAYALSFPSRDGELRAVWCAAGINDWPGVVARLRDARVNAVFLEAGSVTTPRYASQRLPTPAHVPDLPGMVQQAKAAGLQVYAWHAALALHEAAPEVLEAYRGEGVVQKSYDGTLLPWLCPTNERNISLEQDVVSEMVTQLPVDGVIIDYLRFANERCCYCDACRAAFEEQLKVRVAAWPDDVLRGIFRTRYQQFREERIRAAVQAIAQAAKRARPGVIVGVTVAPMPEAAAFGHTRFAEWLGDGSVDQICALDYRQDASMVRDLAVAQARDAAGRAKLCVGLDIVPRSGPAVSPATAAELVSAAREAGADGVALFRCGAQMLLGDLPYLALGAFSRIALPPSQGPDVRVVLENEPLPEKYPRTYAAGQEVTATLQLGQGVALENIHPELEDTATGQRTPLPAPSAAEGGPVTLVFPVPEGRFRISFTDTFTAQGAPPAVTRSAPLQGVSAQRMAELTDEVARARRIDVAVYRDAVGAESIRRALSEAGPDIAVEPVDELSRDALARFDVLVLADLKAPRDTMTPDVQEVVRDFAMDGGGVLLVHDATGLSGIPPLFPAIGGPASTGRSSFPEVEVSRDEHPILEKIGSGRRFRTALSDHVLLQRGALGTPLIFEGQTPDPDQGSLIVGQLQRGRVALCGIGLGMRGDLQNKSESVPQQTEAQLLVNLVRWLGAPAVERALASEP